MRTITSFLTLWAVAAAIELSACDHGARTTSSPPAKGEHAHARYTCPMHPDYVSDRPGSCPICGMKLVPVTDGDAGSSQRTESTRPSGYAGVTLDTERRRQIGLRTVTVRRGPFESAIRTVGRVAVDERRVVKVQPRFEGYVEQLRADFTGKLVRRGEVLASVYSPELLATENELLLAARSRAALSESGLPDAAEAARTRLALMGVTEGQIDAMVKSGKPLRTVDVVAPISGFVTTKSVVAGQRIGPEQPVFEITDLSRVWVLADVYEYEVPRVAAGQVARVTLAYWPDREWRGRVTYVFPTVDEKTRTVRVRVEVDNPKLELKPEMYADVVLEGKAREALLLPDDAVIETGTRKVVFVVVGDGRLEPREVQTAGRARGAYEVRAGVREGEQVASGASFLLDSESRLRAALQSMAPAPGDGGGEPAGPGSSHGGEHAEHAGHQHGGGVAARSGGEP